jgi:hypothetical protein
LGTALLFVAKPDIAYGRSTRQRAAAFGRVSDERFCESHCTWAGVSSEARCAKALPGIRCGATHAGRGVDRSALRVPSLSGEGRRRLVYLGGSEGPMRVTPAAACRMRRRYSWSELPDRGRGQGGSSGSGPRRRGGGDRGSAGVSLNCDCLGARHGPESCLRG